MGKKIFVSYKYSDANVRAFTGNYSTTVRDYVDVLQSKLDVSDHIYKGEDDGEDLSSLEDSTIGSKLGDKIFDSTVTIVLVSKGMKETYVAEKDQWIPWEISYSLREQKREGKTSKTNAMLAVVLPDSLGQYDYFLQHNAECNSTTYMTNVLFEILRENMFNIKQPETRPCNGNTIYSGYFSYIYCVTWDIFINDINRYIDISLEIWRKRDEYNIRKNV